MIVILGKYYINFNEVLYIKRIGTGCNVIFKNDKVLSITDVPESDLDELFVKCREAM